MTVKRVMTTITASPFVSLIDEAVKLQIAEYLGPQDLLHYQCTSKELSGLDTDLIWKKLCQDRWEPWPRYRLTPERHEQLDLLLPHAKTWKERYLITEQDATRTVLRESDLLNLQWYLSFVLSGIRGEGRTDHLPIVFTEANLLLVPTFHPMPYRIVNESPQRYPPTHIRPSVRGDYPFSNTQWFDINSFPQHYIARNKSTAEWLIVNEYVMMVRCKKD